MSKSQLAMYKERQNELLKEHNGKLIAVKDGEFMGEYESTIDAFRDMQKRNYKNGEYMIIQCTPGNSAYTAFFANQF